MSKMVKLSELCFKITDGSHFSPKGIENGIPMLSVKDMRENGFDYSNCKRISEEDYQILCANGCHPECNDILIAKDGSYLKQVFVVEKNEKQAVLSSIGILKPDINKVDPYYIKYYLSSDFVKNEVAKKYVSGSALPRIILKEFSEIEIPYIDMELQHRIVTVLKNIDKKIENNNKINSELEVMAKTIYDYWFLQFEFPNEEGKPYKSSGGKMVWNEELKREIPEGWDNGVLSDFGEVVSGGTPSTKHEEYYCNDGVAWITPNDLSKTSDKYIRHGERDITKLGLKNSSAKLMPKGSVLLTTRAPIGYIAIAGDVLCTNQGFKSIIPNKKYKSEYIYYTINNLTPYLKSLGTGSTFTEISKEVISNVKIIVPSDEIINKFNRIINPLGGQRIVLEQQNKELSKLRNFLIPLLINGQVKLAERKV